MKAMNVRMKISPSARRRRPRPGILASLMFTAEFLVLLLIAPHAAFGQPPPPIALGPLMVHVTSAGAPVPNATVCIGAANDLNLFHQGTTDPQGSVRFGSVPQEPFVATASLSGRGSQRSFSLASPNVPLLRIDLALPKSGGPFCPSTPPGPSRTLGQRIREQAPPVTPVERPTFTLIRPDLRTEFCFGALGAQCGLPPAGLPATALCAFGFCYINGGSWEHDECCIDHPHGMACQLGPLDAITGHDGNCVNAWNKAVRLAGKGLFWKRTVDFSRGNTSGTVEFPLYCAPGDYLVPPEDADKCCSRQTRALNAVEAVAAAAAGETLRACR
jgi:hypothetical protein